MSASTRRPQIRGVERITLGCIVDRRLCVTGDLLDWAAQGLKPETRSALYQAYRGIAPSRGGLVSAPFTSEGPALGSSEDSRRVLGSSLDVDEAARAEALLQVASLPYHIEDTRAARVALRSLCTAVSGESIDRASRQLRQVVDQSSRDVFRHALTAACQTASRRAGFGNITTSWVSPTAIRVVARDIEGRALVTEINGQGDGNPEIHTEVFGVSDGSCDKIMDRFDREIEKLGIRGDDPVRESKNGLHGDQQQVSMASDLLRQRPARRQRNAGESGSSSRIRSGH